jgi:hypothetical protein
MNNIRNKDSIDIDFFRKPIFYFQKQIQFIPKTISFVLLLLINKYLCFIIIINTSFLHEQVENHFKIFDRQMLM